MPVSLFSPLARGFGTWTGELHLAEDDKGPGPSLPSLLPDDPYCHHSGVTVKPRAKSAVSAFSARSAPQSPGRQSAWSEKPDGELVLPKTYLTKKGAIVLFAAPDDPRQIELSERDKLYLKKARKKLLKHRYVEYSNKIGSIHRLAQSVLAFGDDEYDKETDSIKDADKMFLKFTRDQKDMEVIDKHSRPGGNIDMYLNDLMSHSGTRPSTAIIDWRSSADLGPRADSAASSVDGSQIDLLSVDSEQLVKCYTQAPPTTPKTGIDGGRSSPSVSSSRTKKLSAGQLAASLKSGGFLGRQTIIEEIDSISETSSRPMTPANTMSRPHSGTSLLSMGSRSRPSSREKLVSLQRKRSLIDETLTERSTDTLSNISEIKSNKMSRRSASSATSAARKERANASRLSSAHTEMDHDIEIEKEQYDDQDNLTHVDQILNDKEEFNEDEEIADDEIQGIENKYDASNMQDNNIEGEIRTRSKASSAAKSRRKSRSSSTMSFNKDQLQIGTPEVSEVQETEGRGKEDEEGYYLSEDAEYNDEEEDVDWDDRDGSVGATQPLMPSYNPLDISLLSGGSGGGTFSFDATTADNVPEDQVCVDDPVAQAMSKHGSAGSIRSDHHSSLTSSLSQMIPGSSPQSIAERSSPSRHVEEEHLEQGEIVDQSVTQDQEQKTSTPQELDKKYHEEIISKEEDDTAIQDSQNLERPESAASSHSGVPSDTDEHEVTGEVGAAKKKQSKIDDTLDEASTEVQPVVDTAKDAQTLPEYLKGDSKEEEMEEIIAAESARKAPSSYASSVDLPPEPGVTEIHITPRSSAVSSRTEPTTVVVEQKSEPVVTKEIKAPLKTQEVKPTPKPTTEDVKAKPVQEEVKNTAQGNKKLPSQPPTHMTQAKKEPPTPKPQPPKPVKEKKQSEPAKTVKAKEDKKPPVEEKSAVKPEKKVEVEKKEKDQKEKEKPVQVKKEKETKQEKTQKEKKVPEKTEPPKKEYTKVLDISHFDQKKKEEAKVEPPKQPSKELKPESIVSDTKAEIQRLFGSAPIKKETPREKKDRMKREMGPKVILRTPKPPSEPKPAKPTKEEQELEKLEKEVMEAIGGGTSEIPVDEEGGGLTVEEMELEQQLLQQKLADADAKLKGEEVPKPKAAGKKTPREKKSKGKNKDGAEDTEDIAAKREALREAKRLEKQKRLEEAKRVEEELKKKEAEKKKALQNAAARTAYLNEDIEEMKRQAEQAENAEEDARAALAEARKQSREEREKRRKEEQEKKKTEAIQKREKERKRLESGRQREQDMLMKLATKEERLKLAEENRRRREEEEEKAMMDEEEEERLEKRKAEEQESRIAELERQAEEEAMVRLVQEREDALRKKRQMEEMQRKLAEEEDQKRKEYEAEQKKIEDLRLKKEEEEKLRREEEKRRLMELQRMEDEARQKMKQEMQRRREALLRRRDQNLERKSNLDGLKQKQGMTKGWVFSYYVQWPRETYERRMGGSDDKKKKRGKSAPAKTRPTHS